jgi:hypothetical protein
MKISDITKTQSIPVLTMILVAAASTIILFSQDSYNQVIAYPFGSDIRNYTFGTISIIQNDETGLPAWIVAGHWKTNLLDNLIRENGKFD